MTDDFKHLDTGDAARAFLVDNFPGTTVTSWRWKNSDEKDGISIRVFEGPMKLSAAVVYNPHALEEKYALFLDTTGNYDVNKFDPSKFTNSTPSEEDMVKKLFGKSASVSKEVEESEETTDEDTKKKKIKKPKLSKKEKEQLNKIAEDAMTNHNLNVLNTQIILKQNSPKEKIITSLDSSGVTYVIAELTQQLLHGSDEFAAINSKENEKTTVLTVECLAEDITIIRMQIGEFISSIYRKAS